MGSEREAFFRCQDCGREAAMGQGAFACSCGGLFDIAGLDDSFNPGVIDGRAHGIFRYRMMMPSSVDEFWQQATMAEGQTGLVAIDVRRRISAKMDFSMPTLSFKDRGAAVLMASAKSFGAREVIQDSSGNAGNSVAAYAARLGIGCEVFVPESTSPNKVSQIRAYGAKVTLVPGTREDTAAEALRQARLGRYYASHVYNPLFYQGTKTYLYELWEQLDGKLPDALALPAGNGTLLLGAYFGLKSLLKAGAIGSVPKLVVVQAERCAPVHEAFIAGRAATKPVANRGTAAEGIAIAAPMRGRQMLSAIRELGGTVVTVDEESIAASAANLASSGIFVEPTSAATLAGLVLWMDGTGFDGTSVVPMCGAGLKSLH